jgi:hypothetical protein
MSSDHGKCTFDVNNFMPVDSKNRKLVLGNVMWIDREEGLAYRVGVGQIHLQAWARAQPRETRIVLA